MYGINRHNTCKHFGKHAATPNNYVKTVYVDGVKFNVSINDNYEIEVAGHTDTSDAFLLVNQNGIGTLSIDNDSLIAESADYKLDIENLSMTDADVDIYENGIKTDEISSVSSLKVIHIWHHFNSSMI